MKILTREEMETLSYEKLQEIFDECRKEYAPFRGSNTAEEYPRALAKMIDDIRDIYYTRKADD